MKVINNRDTVAVGGTSASTPSFAAIIGLINDQLLSAGKKQLGFLNPFICANPQVGGRLSPFSLGSHQYIWQAHAQ